MVEQEPPADNWPSDESRSATESTPATEATPASEAAPRAGLPGPESFWSPPAPFDRPESAAAPTQETGRSRDAETDFEAELSRRWLSSSYIAGSLLGFQVSVLRQIEFKTVAIPFCGRGDVVWYLAALGKHVLANDPRPWAALAGRAVIESEVLNDEQVFTILQDTYIPGARMSNPELRRWFGEADAWWMDNLRRKALEDSTSRDQVLLLGMQAGDYAQSFDEATCELKRPLTIVFRELARSSRAMLAMHPYNRAYQLPVQQFLRDARADLMYLNLPAGHPGLWGPLDRSAWRDTWILGHAPEAADDFSRLPTLPQSKKAYLETVDRILFSASRIRRWAIECRDIGLASARDISDLIKTHRTIQATYS